MPKHYLTIEEKRAFARRDLDNIRDALGTDTMVSVIPNAMLAGPCAVCRAIGNRAFRLDEAPLPPFDGCSHPDQCACGLSLTDIAAIYWAKQS
jgi:hypothetical protein